MELLSYEDLLAQALNRVADDVDKREGSLIYTALAPLCAELAQAYAAIAGYYDLCFADTAVGEALSRRCLEFGIQRHPATAAIRRGTFTGGDETPLSLAAGQRFSIDGVFFTVLDELQAGSYRLLCEEAGSIGNRPFGTLLPTDYLPGLVSAELGDVLIPGGDEETDEALRLRFLQQAAAPAFGGNIADYQNKIRSLSGVGAVKVTPVPNGGGTVGITILGSNRRAAGDELVAAVQEAVDPVNHSGEGLGLAPIGHRVTVESAEEKTLTASMTLTLAPNAVLETVQQAVSTALERYFAELRADWEQTDALTVRITQIERRALSCDGVLDLSNVRLDGGSGNVLLASSEIPVLGEVSAVAAVS